MTAQEAIDALKLNGGLQIEGNALRVAKFFEGLDVATRALEKQIPKKFTDISKVRDNEGYIGLIGKCPCCGEILEEDTIYCDCGQKLDWGENNA